jgi:adenylate cyclase
MATAPSGGFWQRRGVFNLYELLQSWWRHRISFLLSVAITFLALGLYYYVFIQEKKAPISEFIERLELDSLDTRFRYRPKSFSHPDPRIVIVDIDQHAQEVLGKWPFSRVHFAKMLDVLHDDGAKVVAFDITFSKPDQSSLPIRALWNELDKKRKAGEPVDPKLMAEVEKIAAEFDADKKFAASIRHFGPVILGNFFLYTEADLKEISGATLDAYAQQLAFFAFPQVLGIREGSKKEDRLHLFEEFAGAGLLPRGAEANIDELTTALGGGLSWTGFFNAPPDPDGVVRHAMMVLPFGRSKNPEDWDLYASLDIMTVRAYLSVPDSATILRYGQTGIYDIELGSDTRVRPDDLGRILINYQGPWGTTYLHKSIADVIAGKVAPATFRDKIVLVGATATGIGDLRPTPYGGTDYPGIGIHANVIDNILNQGFLKRGPKQALIDALLILFFGIPLGIWMALVSPRWMWFGFGLLAPLAALDYLAFLRGSWLNFTVPAATLMGNVILVSLYRVLIEEKEKRRVRSFFGQFVSPEVIRRLLVNPELVQPKKTDITVMFSDIRGFTTISEKLDAQDLALFLNEYLSDMTQIVFAHQGTLDKYIGDAVMAFWGAPYEEPGHAARACNSALDMMKRVQEMQKTEAEGKPHLDIGIGLNTGVASVGKMGSDLRAGYTALGDTVNLSSRLEGLNKEYGTHILANETTYQAAKDAGFLFRELDLIRVKGKLQPATIYELLGRSAELAADQDLQARLEQFAQARELYRKREWSKAQRTFEDIIAKWEDGPSRAYWKRCQEYLFDEPSSGWDGVFTMTHK